jgi:molybdopterin-guanine dinucleotide biosynthesis protein B
MEVYRVTTVIAVIGSKKSGKTQTMEYLISQLTDDGFKVGTVKHIHDEGFTIDTEGKDTWRFARAGAKVVLSVAPDEVALIRKTTQLHQNLDNILALLMDEDVDVILLEGFYTLISERKDVYKIITAKDKNDLVRLLKGTHPPILAATGLVGENTVGLVDFPIPILSLKTEGRELIKLIVDIIGK